MKQQIQVFQLNACLEQLLLSKMADSFDHIITFVVHLSNVRN